MITIMYTTSTGGSLDKTKQVKDVELLGFGTTPNVGDETNSVAKQRLAAWQDWTSPSAGVSGLVGCAHQPACCCAHYLHRLLCRAVCACSLSTSSLQHTTPTRVPATLRNTCSW